jgi:hypothetical protein
MRIIIECPRRRRILLVLPQVRRGILDGSTCPFGVLATDRNSTGIPVPLPFFYVEISRGIPVPVKKTERTGIPQVLLPLRTST